MGMKKQILLIEDEVDLRENIVEMLEMEGFQVMKTTSRDAKKLLKNNSFQITICNESMLDRPISQLFDLIRKQSDTVIMLCSDVDDSRFYEADLKISMPFDESTLIEMVIELLRASGSDRLQDTRIPKFPIGCL